MEFLEFIFLLSVTVLLPLTILKTVVDYKKSRLEAERDRGPGTDAGVTVGELKKMLAEVVREANAPLVERIEALEREREGLPPPEPRGLLADVEDEWAEHEREAEKSVGRRVRG
jgi:hypothetical protein